MTPAWTLALVLGLTASAPSTEGSEPAQPDASLDETEQAELVLIHVAPDRPELRARLQAELGLLGFVSERLRLADDEKVLGPDLIERLPEKHADAAIEIALTETRINVWVADGKTGTTLHRRLDLTTNPEFADPRTLAISAVELLRAARLEFPGDEEPSEVAPPLVTDSDLPPTEVELPEPEPRPRASLSLAPLITGSPGGFGPAALLEVAGRWAPLERFALRTSLLIPTVGNRTERTEGSVRMFFGMLFVEPQLRLPHARWFYPELGLGLGLTVTGFVGAANESNISATDVIASFAAHGHLGFGFAVTPRIWIRIDGYVGVVTPKARVVLFNDTVTWGQPWGAGSFGLELWLW